MSKSRPDHYSYTVYADPATARTFDRRRFGGPIGQLIAEEQGRVLTNFVGRINYAASELDCAQSELREAADLLTSVRLNTTPFDRDSCL